MCGQTAIPRGSQERSTQPSQERRERPRRDVLAKWVTSWDQKWTFFVTLTFRNPKTNALGAATALRSWVMRHRSGSRPRLLIWVAEAQRRGTAHIHALWAAGGKKWPRNCDACTMPSRQRASFACAEAPNRAFCLNESWFRFFGIARFLPYDGRHGAAWYLTKYIFKGDDDPEWGIWEGSQLDADNEGSLHAVGRNRRGV